MASGTDGNIISYDASGNPVAIATGNDGQVLTSTGAGSPPAFEDAGGGGATALLSSTVLSSHSGNAGVNISGNFSSTYKLYKLYVYNFSLTGGTGAAAQVISGGSRNSSSISYILIIVQIMFQDLLVKKSF